MCGIFIFVKRYKLQRMVSISRTSGGRKGRVFPRSVSIVKVDVAEKLWCKSHQPGCRSNRLSLFGTPIVSETMNIQTSVSYF